MTDRSWIADCGRLADVAAQLLAGRERLYPQLVAAGKLIEAQADDGIRIMSAIAADWQAVAALEPEPGWLFVLAEGGALPSERIDVLTDCAIRNRTIADASDGDAEKVSLAEAVEALFWWETARPSARFYVDTTIALRAQAAERRLAPTRNHTLFGEAA